MGRGRRFEGAAHFQVRPEDLPGGGHGILGKRRSRKRRHRRPESPRRAEDRRRVAGRGDEARGMNCKVKDLKFILSFSFTLFFKACPLLSNKI